MLGYDSGKREGSWPHCGDKRGDRSLLPCQREKNNGYRRPERQIEKITQRLFTNAIR